MGGCPWAGRIGKPRDQNTAGLPAGVKAEYAITMKPFRAKPSQTGPSGPTQARFGRLTQADGTEFKGWTWIQVWGSTRHQETGRRLDLNQEIRSTALEPAEAGEFIIQKFIECLLHVSHSPTVCWLISGQGLYVSLKRSLHDSHIINVLLFKSYEFLDIF